jgi:hypothetical protein
MRVIDPSQIRPAHVGRSWRSRAAWIGLGIALALAGGCTTKSDPYPEETAALKALLEDYKLDNYEKNPEGRVNHCRMEAARFDDDALVLAGKFREVQGLSIWNSRVTDVGLEKLPVLKTLATFNIIANGVTDRGLLALRKQPSLTDIWLVETDKLTKAGMDSLKKANPGVRLHVMNRPQKKKS